MFRRRIMAVGLGLVALAAAGYALYAQPTPPKPAADGPAKPDLTPLRHAFRTAFEARDAEAISNLWTADAEMTTTEGETVRGRAAIRDAYAALFKARPKVKAEVESGEARALTSNVVVADGVLKLTSPDDPEPDVSIFSAILVREGDAWKFASLQSWEADAEELKLSDLEWLIGEWAGKGEDGELKTTYAWDGKAFIKCSYSATKDGKAAAGTQMIGGDPAGGVRSWLFDQSGATGESVWEKDGGRWLLHAHGTLADGTPVRATTVVVPLGKDAFTWQSIDRVSGGEPQPDGKPVKMTRVAAK